MPNSKQLVDTIPSSFTSGLVTAVYEYAISIDQTNQALDIRTPAPGKRIYVVGIWLSNADACNLTFVSGGGTKAQTLELAANQGLPGFTTAGYYFATLPGQKLSVESSANIVSTIGQNFVLRVCEGEASQTIRSRVDETTEILGVKMGSFTLATWDGPQDAKQV